MKTLITILSFMAAYALFYVTVAGFFACVTPATFTDIAAHPAYGVMGSIIFAVAAGVVADDVWQSLNR